MNDPQSIHHIANQASISKTYLTHIILAAPVGLAIYAVVINFFFCQTCYNTINNIPRKNRTKASWFSWLILIPFIGHIFQWIMLPFAIPSSIKNHTKNETLLKQARSLSIIGLCYVIVTTLTIIPYAILIVGVPMLALWLIYWDKIYNINLDLSKANNVQSSLPLDSSKDTRKNTRPIGLSIALYLALLSSTFILFLALFKCLTMNINSRAQSIEDISNLISHIITLLPFIILAILMLKGRNWARVGYVITVTVLILIGIYINEKDILSSTLGPLLFIIILYTPKANHFFAYRKKIKKTKNSNDSHINYEA